MLYIKSKTSLLTILRNGTGSPNREIMSLYLHRGWKLNNCITSIRYSLLFSPNYSLFISNFSVIFIIHFLVFVSIFLSEIFYNAILYIGYQKFTFQYTFNLFFSKYHSTFSIHVVKTILSFSIKRPSMQLLELDGPNNSSLSTRK